MECHRASSFRLIHHQAGDPVSNPKNILSNNLENKNLLRIKGEPVKELTNLIPKQTEEGDNCYTENQQQLSHKASFRLFYPENDSDVCPSSSENGGTTRLPASTKKINQIPTFKFEMHESHEKSLERVATFRLFYPDNDSITNEQSDCENGALMGHQNEAKNLTNVQMDDNKILHAENSVLSIGEPPPFVRKSSFKKHVENGYLSPKTVLMSEPAPSEVKPLTGLEIRANPNSNHNHNGTNMWRKLNAIRVESCVSLSKQVCGKTFLMSNSVSNSFEI